MLRNTKILSTALVLSLSTMAISAPPVFAAPHTVATVKASKPKITKSPKKVSVASGKTVKFTVKAKGTKLSYQWYSKKATSTKWKAVSGSSAKTKTLKVKARTKLHGTSFRVIVKNSSGRATSKTARLSVESKPKFTSHPKSFKSKAGEKKTLSAKASGNGLKFQWQTHDGTAWKNVSGATKSSYSLNVRSGTTKFRVQIKNKAGKASSTVATVTGIEAPRITSQPESISLELGKSGSLTAKATGTNLKYQWESYSGSAWNAIPSATNASLAVSASGKKQVTRYRVKVSNELGSVLSEEALVLGISTASSPFASEIAVAAGGDYGFWVSRTSSSPISDTSYNATVAIVDFCYFNERYSGLPWFELDVDYIGTDGRAYDEDGVYIDGDIWDTTTVYDGDCDQFAATAIVPTAVVYGGNWRIVDNSAQYGNGTIYIEGARSSVMW